MRFFHPTRRAVLLGGLASLAARPGRADAVIPLQNINGLYAVPVTLNGGTAQMIIDTGAERTAITADAAARLYLRFDAATGTSLRGFSGQIESHQNADVSGATLGGITLMQRPPDASLSLAVTSSPLAGADGLLGADILSQYTLDLNFPQNSLGLSTAQPGNGQLPLQLLWPGRVLTNVTLDGCALTALIDTGATATTLNGRGLSRLNLTPSQLAADQMVQMAGIGGPITSYLHHFNSLQIGPVLVPSPVLMTAEAPEMAYDMVLGLDVLRSLHLTLSYAGLSLGISQD